MVQLQMFHKKYLERLELPVITARHDSMVSGIQPSSSVNYGNLEAESSPCEEQQQRRKSHYTRINVSDLKNLTTKQVSPRTWTKKEVLIKWASLLYPFSISILGN